MADQTPQVILPQNQPAPLRMQEQFSDPRQPMAVAKQGGGGGVQIVIGLVMLLAGIGLSVSGVGRVFVGLIAFGVINLIRGIANSSRA